jgi:hypothetical protein
MTQPFSFNFGGFRCSAVNFQSRFASKANQSGLLPLFRTVVRGIGLALLCAVAAIGLTGCGSNGGMTTPPGPTKVTLVYTGTADDQFNEFTLFISSVTLTNQAGTNTVTLFTVANPNEPQGPEFIHVNGTADPLAIVNVPQDTYTTATVTMTLARLVFFTPNPPMPFTVNSDSVNTQTSTVTLATPIQIKGAAMALALDLQVAPSVATVGNQTTVTPTFNLEPITLAATPTNAQNGLVEAVEGRFSSVSTTDTSFGFVTAANAPFTISTNASTVFSGVSGFSALVVNQLAVVDAAIQQDGSLLATRVYVADPNAGDAQLGPVVDPPVAPGASGEINLLAVQAQGNELSTTPILLLQYAFSGTTPFRTPSEVTNIDSLPFTASFASGADLFVGQNVYVTTQMASFQSDPITQASSITLMPQTVNGTVNNVAMSGNFQVFTVILQPNETLTVSNGATSVVVYVDSNTKMLNSAPIISGSVVRFRGLLFNDGGTLRMDASQANDGVAD